MSDVNEYPPGWNEARVREVLDYYEHQNDADAAAEHEAALSSQHTVMEVPTELVPIFRQLIAEHQAGRSSRGFLDHRDTIHTGSGSSVEDVQRVRTVRGTDVVKR